MIVENEILVNRTLQDKYLVEELLGSGGMCDVYRARHVVIGKEVALKVLKPGLAADPVLAERFEQEARTASMIRHPHAVNVTDFGVADNIYRFIVMDLVKGETLDHLVERVGPLPVARAANILRQVCGALDAAHSAGVIHRDIKPGNIIISDYEGSDWVTVVDFGVSKVLEDANRRAAVTGANLILGTPRYMSPEQCEGKTVDARSDIYSLGIVLYEMLAGHVPFEADTATRLMICHVSGSPTPLRISRPDLLPELETVVMSALEKDPERRPQGALEFADRFEQAAHLDQAARAFPDRGTPSRIRVPFPEDNVRGQSGKVGESSGPDSEATIVRRRSAGPQAPDTERIDRSGWPIATKSNPYETMPVAPLSASAGAGFGRQEWLVAALAIAIVAALITLLAFRATRAPQAQNTDVQPDSAPSSNASPTIPASSATDLLTAARQAVAAATTQVQSLPDGQPLKDRLPQLQRWQTELASYAAVQQPTPQMTSTAEKYKQQADKIAGAARAAQASLAPTAQEPNSGEAGAPSGPAKEPPADQNAKQNASPAAGSSAIPVVPAIHDNGGDGQPPVDLAAQRAAVTATVMKWAAAFNQHDIREHMSYYADDLDSYYLARNVGKNRVREDREGAYRYYSTVNVQISNLHVEMDPSGKEAVATYDKTWNFDGEKSNSGKVLERLSLKNMDGHWRITGERDLKVYYKNE